MTLIRRFVVCLVAALFAASLPASAALQYSTTHRNDALSDLVTLAGATPYLLIYCGSAPANVGTTDTNTIAAALPIANPLGTVSNGVLTFGTITSASATTSCTVGHFRVATSAAGTTPILQGTIGTVGADLNLNSVSISTGQILQVTSYTITENGQ